MNSKNILTLVFFLLLNLLSILVCSTSFAEKNELAKEQEKNITSSSMNDDFEWQILIDLSILYNQEVISGITQDELLHYFTPGLRVNISYKNFFLRSNQRRSSLHAGEIGYQLIVEKNWQLDIIAKAYMQGFSPKSLIKDGTGDEEILADLTDRDPALGIALQYSHFIGNAFFSLDIASAHTGDYSGDVDGKYNSGLVIDSFYSYLLPYRNWDIYFGTGLTYFDQKIVNHYIGISPNEATKTRQEYKAKAGFRGLLEVYAQHPLSESWSFNAGITHNIFSKNIKDSPIVDKNHTTQVMIGVVYVF